MTTPIKKLVAEAFALLAPPTSKTLSEWADENYYLSPESSADPGKWKTRPSQKDIMDACSDPEIERVSVRKSARVGYTKIMNAIAAYYVDHAPCPILLVQPTLDDAEMYAKEEIYPMIRDNPVLQKAFRYKRSETEKRKPKNNEPRATTLHKSFIGGVLQLVGANTPRGFRRTSRKVILLDEEDGYPQSAGKEGDPVRLAIKRSESYWDRKIIEGSTPTIAGLSRIDSNFKAGDQRYRYLPCPHCDEYQVLEFKNLRWPKGKPEEAMFFCVGCGAGIEHKHLRAMDARGKWVAHAPENFARSRHASFHLWAAYSYSPNATWAHIAKEWDDAQVDGIDAQKTFIMTVLGEPWQEKGEAPEWERLYERREKYEIGTVPAGGLLLTSGVDVQKDRLEYEVVAWGRGKQSWSIDEGILLGDTSAPEVWKKLDELLDRTYTHESGGEMPIVAMAVDSGYNTQDVYSWCRTKSGSRVLAIKGSATSSVLLGSPTTVDVTIKGRRLARGAKVWPVGSSIAKGELYGWLRLKPPTEESGEDFPPGYCHFPQYGEEYFKQLTAEQISVKKKRSGGIKREWEVIPGRQNHGLDRRVYARAAATFFGIDRFKQSDWDQLAASIGMQIKKERAKTNTASKPIARKPSSGYLPRRGKDWLKKEK